MYYVSNKIVEKKLKMDLCNYMRVIETLSRDLLMMIHFRIDLVLVSAWIGIVWLRILSLLAFNGLIIKSYL